MIYCRFYLLVLFEFFMLYRNISAETPLWNYQCIDRNCERSEITSNTTIPQSLGACQIFCGEGTLWPYPSEGIFLSQTLINIDMRKIRYFPQHRHTPVNKLIKQKINDLKNNFQKYRPERKKNVRSYRLMFNILGIENYNDTSLTINTDESYTIKTYKSGLAMRIVITARNYFGVRHAFETLHQLIFFNDVTKQIQMPDGTMIFDKPSYQYRGVMLDTSRNFIDKSAIKKTIQGMGMSKLNTLHWHITDQQSFPYSSRTWPNFTRYGAYSPSKVYTAEDIKEIKDFGIYHGVRVIPELDAPAHVSEGWQWIEGALLCYREMRWQDLCSGPPCGQLNPLSEKVYEILAGLYKDMIADFGIDIFHMGGDQVNKNCWQSSEAIRQWAKSNDSTLTDEKFIQLWNSFQERAYKKLKAANGGRDQQVILWSSDLTKKSNLDNLDNRTYIIQNWYSSEDTQTITDLINAGFRVIFSPYDVNYLDCGFGSHVSSGNNWCSPYNNWKKIYNYSPLKVLKKLNLESKNDLIFGGEVILWSESVDGNSLDARLWPRAAALAGRLWNDKGRTLRDSWRDVESRMFIHRDRLVGQGILAKPMAPEWCRQNQGLCRIPWDWDFENEVTSGVISYDGTFVS